MLVLWIFRFFVFNLYESPKYLMGRGKDAAAVEVVHKVAQYNGVTSNLGVEELERVGKYGGEIEDTGVDTSALGAIKRQMSKFSGDHVRALFATRKLAWSTSILIVLWGKSSPFPLLRLVLIGAHFSFHRSRFPALQQLRHILPRYTGC